MKVAIYTMQKNELQHVEAFMRSCAEADGVFILDTGSTDGSDKLLRDRGATVHDAAIRPWRFDTARNVALSLVPAEYDVCIKLDLDERLVGDWRSELERAWMPDTTRASYWYVWNWLPNGQPDVTFWSDLIHSRFNYFWRFPTHEALYETVPQKFVELQSLQIHQFPTVKPRPDDLPILRLGVQENPTEPRCSYMLARELANRKMHQEAIEEFQRYLAMPNAIYVEERASAMLYMSECHTALGDKRTALQWAYRAAGEYPYQRENWIGVAWLCNELQDWMGGYLACKQALAIKERSKRFLNKAYAWGEMPWDLLSVAAWYLGYLDEGLAACKEGLKISPGNEHLLSTLKFYQAARHAKKR